MKWLSRGVEELICGELQDREGIPIVHDAIVVGSGYGGAVSALRLAEKGVKVLVLERGEEWISGEFPNDIGNAFGALRVDRQSASNITGSESGLYDFRMGEGIGALVGNGLGGTSLINAGVVMMPDIRVFAKTIGDGPDGARRPAWPQGMQKEGDALPSALTDAFDLARANLGAEEFSTIEVLGGISEDEEKSDPVFAVVPDKHLRLQELAELIRHDSGKGCTVSFEPAALTVTLGKGNEPPDNFNLLTTCAGCGDCVSGCNQNAKKSLNTTYLYQAHSAGARMFTGVSVLTIKRDPDGHWVVEFARTSTRSKQRDGIDIKNHRLHAKHVILSAGTFGSSEILHRSKVLPGAELPVSDRLGQRLSTNGDSVSFGYMLNKPVNGIGMGSDQYAGTLTGVGPTITGAIKIECEADVEQSVLIEEGAIPRAIARLFHEMISTSATFAQLDKCSFRGDSGERHTPEGSVDWATLQPAGLSHTQTLLAMGHDNSLGTIDFDATLDRPQLHYASASAEPVYRLQEKYLSQIEAQGAIFIQNPVLSPLPEPLRRVLDAPVPGNAVFTVHPLGGCCMADTADLGVVDSDGRVFDATNTSRVAVLKGLYVLDGSIVPTALGANPLLTITALAEKAMMTLAPQIAADVTAQPSIINSLPAVEPYAPLNAPWNPHASEMQVNFTEAMRGVVRFGGLDHKAHLVLHLPVQDMAMFWADRAHQIVIPNQRNAVTGDREEIQARLRMDLEDAQDARKILSTRNLLVTSGVVSILPVVHARWDRALSGYVRAILTWFLDRGFQELVRVVTDIVTEHPAKRSEAGVCERIRGFLKLAKHASESRGMEYRLNLIDEFSQGAAPYQTYTLIGTKQVGYPAPWTALWRKAIGVNAYLDRANVWSAFGEMSTQIFDSSGKPVGHGVLNLDLLDMTRMHAPQIGLQRDTPNSLMTLAGYPLWFARLLVKTRLWDFRLPDYPKRIPKEFDLTRPEVPKDDVPTIWPTFPKLKVYAFKDSRTITKIPPEPSQSVWVRRSKTDGRQIELKLTRYKQDTIARVAEPADGPVRIKAMLMLNGFAQSTLGFVPEEHTRRPTKPGSVASEGLASKTELVDEPGLAEFFYEQGFDIWLFDYRTSSILDASKLPCSMDDIAEFDIPGAVDAMLKTLRAELRIEETSKAQIYAFAHCVGAASLAMSLLGGYLQYTDQTGIGKLAGVTFSQMQMLLVGSRTAQLRLQVGGLLRDTLGIDYLRLSAAERVASPFESLLDRLFASLPVDPGEQCPHEDARYVPRPDICTCKRMSGTISRLLKHDMIKPETHEKLPVYFGRANTSLLVHGGRCVENERLVNADGQNVYVSDENFHNYLRLPIAILHGEQNALFDIESGRRTFEQLCRVNQDMARTGLYKAIFAPDFAHFDCTIGYGPAMQEQILTKLEAFYSAAWSHKSDGGSQTPSPEATGEPRSQGKAPLAGPLIGWTRTETADGKAQRTFRIWIEVDETEANPASHAITLVRQPSQGHLVATTLWPIIRIPLVDFDKFDARQLRYPTSVPAKRPYVSIAMADLSFAEDMEASDISVVMFSVHEFTFHPLKSPSSAPQHGPGTAATKVPVPNQGPSVNTGTIAKPITEEEVRDDHAVGGTPGIGDVPFSTVWDLVRLFKPLSAKPTLTERVEAPLGNNKRIRTIGVNAKLMELLVSPGGIRASSTPISKEDGEQLLTFLRRKEQARCATALRGDPATLSRKLRQIPSAMAFPTWATIPAALMRTGRQWRGLRFVAACCRYPGLAFEDVRADASFNRIDELLKSDTEGFRDFMFMLGDQIYADASAGLLDSPSPIEKIAMRNRRAFSTAGFHRVTSQLPTYMVIDDHEIADNWSSDDLNLSATGAAKTQAQALFDAGRASFTAYQWAHSPRNVDAPGFNYSIEEKEFPFFVLDTRTQRTGFAKAPRVISQEQLDALEAWLDGFRQDDAKPKFVVSGSVFAPGLSRWLVKDGLSDPMAESWQMAAQQRADVLRMIASRQVKNVVFLSGDYHCSATAQLKLGSAVRAYAIVTPPLYAPMPGVNTTEDEILLSESIATSDGSGPLSVEITAKAIEGHGFADIHIDRLPNERWKLSVHFYLLRLEDKLPRYKVRSEQFLLQ